MSPQDAGENQAMLRGRTKIAQMQAEPVEPVPPITLEGVDHVEATAGRKVRRGRPFVEGDGLRRSRPVTQVQTQVTAIRAKRLGPDDLGLAAEQQGLTISDAKRRQHLDLVVKARLQIGERRGRLDPNGPRERIAIQPGCRICLQTPLQLREPAGTHCQTGGHGMSAKSMEQRSTVTKAVAEAEALDAARRPAPFAAAGAEDKGWPAEPLHPPTRRKTPHAAPPAGPRILHPAPDSSAAARPGR